MSEFICPICKNSLNLLDRSYQCQKKHSFDVSSSRYTNLLPANFKRSKDPGDTKEMVAARRNFLSKDFYKPISDTLNKTLVKYLNKNKMNVVIDMGCGEGYYTANGLAFLKQNQIKSLWYGLDISKYALAIAGKRTKEVTFAVASLFNLPIRDNACNMVVNMFAPLCEKEFRRVLKKGGYLVIASPSKEHLFGLKSSIYDDPYENEVEEKKLEGFILKERINTNFTLRLTNQEDIKNLFSMTPYYWKSSVETGRKVQEMDLLNTKIDVDFWIYSAV